MVYSANSCPPRASIRNAELSSGGMKIELKRHLHSIPYVSPLLSSICDTRLPSYSEMAEVETKFDKAYVVQAKLLQLLKTLFGSQYTMQVCSCVRQGASL